MADDPLDAALKKIRDRAAIARAYADYCNACPGTPWSFGQWVEGFRGLSR